MRLTPHIDRRCGAKMKSRLCVNLYLAISVVSRHQEILRAQWWVSRQVQHRRCHCIFWVTTGKLKYDQVGHVTRDAWALADSFLDHERVIKSLQKAFERAGIEDYTVTDEEKALCDLAEHMGYFDYFIVRHGHEENHNVSGRAKGARH